MDIDHLIQIGSSSILSASNPALSYRTLGADQNTNQAVTTEESRTKSGIVKVNIEAPPMLSSRHTFPLTRHSSLYPLDIDYFIQIGNSCGARPATEKTETSIQLATCERTSPSSAFTRHTKFHLWGKCVSKLKKLFFS
ncbi:hypothetical protein K7432_005976 [Basidiobolus ranarum]|uniref:Uncharacterized protein n=1 Tax=Basidiobolus ranarum TaxID=34480 RepID=A0ABR2WVT4_9FUNG